MGQITKKVWKILLIVLGIASVTVLLTLMWHLLYYRTHYSSSKFAYNGNGRLLLEGGGEYDECISVKLEGNYFDHKMFYPDKDSIWVKADCNGRAVFDGYYYAGNMGDYAPDLMDPEDNAVLEEYNGRLAYADYRDKADKWKERYGENAQKREESVYSRLQNYQRESTNRQTKQSSKNMGRGER